MPDSFHLNDVIGPIISIGAAAVSAYFAVKQARFTKENFKIQRGNDLFKWGSEAIDLLQQAESLSFHKLSSEIDKNAFIEKKIDLMCRLSACIEKGRMYFPNTDESKHGLHKDEAYQGFRQPIFNYLVYTYRILDELDGIDANSDVRVRIEKEKKRFVSILQKKIDPRRRYAFLKNELRESGLQEELRERDLEGRPK